MEAMKFLRRTLDRILLIEDDLIDDDQHVDDDEYEAEDADSASARVEPGRSHEVGRIIPLSSRENRADFGGMAMVLARPKSMDDAKSVGERVRDRVPVIMNLEGIDDAMKRRIVDFVCGVVFALRGSISRAGAAVYLCAPDDIPVEDIKSDAERARGSLFEAPEEQQRMASSL